MTVLDTSVVVDYLLEQPLAGEIGSLFADEIEPSAPDVLVFEVLAALRRQVGRGTVQPSRGADAIEDLDSLRLELFPSMSLRLRAWDLRDNIAAGDALFVALAEQLDEPLVTKDRGLARAARTLGVGTIELG